MPPRHPNPFEDYIVTDPWRSAVVDVPRIHAKAFALCDNALTYVRDAGKSTSVLLHGDIGSGKTHLLGRLRRLWADVSSSAGDLPTEEVVFVIHRFAPIPSMIWRQLRRSFVDDLLRTEAGGETQLHRLLLRQLARVRPAEGHLLDWWDWMRQSYAGPGELDQQLDELFEQLDQELVLGRNLCVVLSHLFQDRCRRDSRDWLRGVPLPENALAALGLAGTFDEDEEQEDHAREILRALCRLAGPRHPVVVCFDQIEALQVHLKDHAGLFAFGQLVGALYDQTSNVLMISCVQSSFFENLRDFVSGPNYDRLTKYEGSLDLLTWDQAAELVQRRLDAEPELTRDRAAHADNPLWPLAAANLRAGLGNKNCTARAVLTLAARLMGAVPPPSPQEFLLRIWKERLEQAAERVSPDRTDGIIAGGLRLLLNLADTNWKPEAIDRERDLDLVLQSPEGRIAISLCNQPGMTSLASRFRRLLGHFQTPRFRKLVIVRNPRLPITTSAKATRAYLDDLIAKGAHHLRPSDEALAALDALHGLLADAKSGDLVNAGEAIGPIAVQEWLAANLPPALREFLEDLVSFPRLPPQGETDEKLFGDLFALVEERRVVRLDEAADAIRRPGSEVEECARRHAQEIGLLQGPPMVLFQRTAGGSER